MALDRAFWEDQLTKAKAALEAWQAAELAIAGGEQSYTIDTGQTRMSVTRADAATIRSTIEILSNRISSLEARLCGATTRVIPGW